MMNLNAKKNTKSALPSKSVEPTQCVFPEDANSVKRIVLASSKGVKIGILSTRYNWDPFTRETP